MYTQNVALDMCGMCSKNKCPYFTENISRLRDDKIRSDSYYSINMGPIL